VRGDVVKRGHGMIRKGYTPEQIINKLREAEILLSHGAMVGEQLDELLKNTNVPY
jgi:hypothetical protein